MKQPSFYRTAQAVKTHLESAIQLCHATPGCDLVADEINRLWWDLHRLAKQKRRNALLSIKGYHRRKKSKSAPRSYNKTADAVLTD